MRGRVSDSVDFKLLDFQPSDELGLWKTRSQPSEDSRWKGVIDEDAFKGEGEETSPTKRQESITLVELEQSWVRDRNC